MNPDLGAMAFGTEETRLGAMANGARGLGEASDVAVTWRRRGQGLDAIDLGAKLGAVDLGAELLPYRSWRLK